MQSQKPSMATMSLIPAHRFAVKDACMLYSSLWLTRDRAHVVACSSPSLISSAAIVQGSLFISHLLVGNRLKEDFWAKSGCTLMAHQGRMQSHCTWKWRNLRESAFFSATPIGHQDKSNLVGEGEAVHFPLTDEWWQGVAGYYPLRTGRTWVFFTR